MKPVSQAHIHRTIMAGLALVDDRQASEGCVLFPEMKRDGSLIRAGTRINWNGVLKRASSDLWDTEENTPDNAPTLWEDIAYCEGCRIIPEVITAALAFALDEMGWWNGKKYRSLIAANVHTPAQHPEGWEEAQT